ncbi:hypothetical protein [Acidiphilium sp. C61]|uniref:hypothetical protein n=1 Tax=Acidiphilium sp. C61 TaxID=1671485 RepID=UPI00157A37C8|nr:hypothetical protein [Acidiphilium sp. C61]
MATRPARCKRVGDRSGAADRWRNTGGNLPAVATVANTSSLSGTVTSTVTGAATNGV